jgi:hypothetical protein
LEGLGRVGRGLTKLIKKISYLYPVNPGDHMSEKSAAEWVMSNFFAEELYRYMEGGRDHGFVDAAADTREEPEDFIVTFDHCFRTPCKIVRYGGRGKPGKFFIRFADNSTLRVSANQYLDM